MNKRTLLLCLMLLLLPSTVLAHSKLESATPAQDAAVAESPQSLSLTFNTKIENLSKFTLTDSAGAEVAIGAITVDGATMSSSPAASLPNDTYSVNWTIIGSDGHMVQGQYSFTVDAPIVTSQPVEEPTATASAGEPAPSSSPDNEASVVEQPVGDLDRKDSSLAPLLIIGAIIAIAAAILLSRRKKR